MKKSKRLINLINKYDNIHQDNLHIQAGYYYSGKYPQNTGSLDITLDERTEEEEIDKFLNTAKLKCYGIADSNHCDFDRIIPMATNQYYDEDIEKYIDDEVIFEGLDGLYSGYNCDDSGMRDAYYEDEEFLKKNLSKQLSEKLLSLPANERSEWLQENDNIAYFELYSDMLAEENATDPAGLQITPEEIIDKVISWLTSEISK